MTVLQQIRKKYPQYNDMSDKELADKVYAKYYSDMPKQQYYQKVGLQQPQTLIEKIANSPAVQFALGAQRGTTEPFVQAGDIVNKLINKAAGTNLAPISQLPQQQGFAGQAGEVAGNLAGYLGGGELLGAGIKGLEEAPLVGKAAQELGAEGRLPQAVRNITGAAGYGALTSPQDRSKGALYNTAAAGAFEGMPLVSKLLSNLNPNKYASNILNKLTPAKSLTENAASLAGDIKDSANGIKEQYKAMFEPIKETAGNKSIYQSELGNVPTTYKNTFKGLKKPFLGSASDFHDDFMESPTFENAHKLQSELGAEARSIVPTSSAERAEKLKISKLRGSLKNDINNFLIKKDPTGDLANKYNKMGNFYLNEYVPYKSIPAISKILQGKGVTSNQLLNAFKTPKIAMRGGDEINYAQKVSDDLGSDGKNKILFAELGKIRNATPEKLVNAGENFNKSGLESHVTPTLASQLETLKKIISAKKVASTVGGAAIAYPLVAKSGLPAPLGAAALSAGGAGGYYLGSKLADALASIFPTIGKAAEPAKKTILSNLPNLLGGQ